MKLTLMEKEAPCLPQEIITTILLRLPVKSLIRFQCVCKDWKSLLKTPCFISQHLTHSTNHNPLIVVDWHISGTEPWRLSLFNAEMQFLEFHNPHVIDPSIKGWVYSSNSLLCVELVGRSHHSLWLWNPSIRVVRLLPQSLNNFDFGCTSVGFGFSPIVNDYNIVKLYMSHRLVVKGEVYSLRTGLWREVDVGNIEGVPVERCKSLNCIGAIFWFGRKVEDGEIDVIDFIVSFDIANGVFTLIPFPSLPPGPGSCYTTLTSYGNKLAMFSPRDVENSESYRIDLWVLEECTDPSKGRWSWTKIYSSIPNPYRLILCPEIIWRNEIVCTVEALPEELLFEGEEEGLDEEKVAFCNIATNEFNIVDIIIPDRKFSPEIFEYVESLVLLEDEAPCLPLEVITNILVRLLVKSLIGFQCVCKLWKNLIKTPSFISEQLHHSTQQNPLLLFDWNISEGGDPCQLFLLNSEMQVLGFQNNFDSATWGWVHSCNGLLCVQLKVESQCSIWLWNPSIRVVKPVPESPNNNEYEYFSVGFGFSPIDNDYKIVKLLGDFVVQGEVYSLKTGLWRKVDVNILEGLYCFIHNPLPFNGALFWVAQKKDVGKNINSHMYLIVSFDIASEVFTLIPYPTLTSSDLCFYKLARYENKLALLFPNGIETSSSNMIDMWVLEECADPSMEKWSWAKIYTSKPNPYLLNIFPEVIWRNEIVCSVEDIFEDWFEGEEEYYEAEVAFCNLNTDEFNKFTVPKRSYRSDIVDYVESLVLLDNTHI